MTTNRYILTATATTSAKAVLYRFAPHQNGQAPSWDGHGEPIQPTALATPITDPSWWQGRYALCPIELRSPAGQSITMPIAVVSVSKTKHIVETQVVGMAGTIKEYISDGDYDLTIEVGLQSTSDGIIADVYPSEELRALTSLLDRPEALEVYSPFLELFDIGRIVVRGYSLQQMTESNLQYLSISAVSDDEYNVYSTDY